MHWCHLWQIPCLVDGDDLSDSEGMGEYKRLNAGVEPVGGESILGGDQEERGGGVIHYFKNNIIRVRQRGASIKILFT